MFASIKGLREARRFRGSDPEALQVSRLRLLVANQGRREHRLQEDPGDNVGEVEEEDRKVKTDTQTRTKKLRISEKKTLVISKRSFYLMLVYSNALFMARKSNEI